MIDLQVKVIIALHFQTRGLWANGLPEKPVQINEYI